MTKILVIEYNHDLRADVLEMLALEGYEVSGAENGLVGVQVARQEQPDLILCDIMMPKMDGFEVLETLRSEPNTASIPFVFLTAKTERIDMRQGMVLGAEDYLMKPFEIEELLESIATQLKKRRDLDDTIDKRMEQLRENIVTALPHELRTSLNTIIGYSEILEAEAQIVKPDQVAAWARHIHNAAFRLYHLVENYLYYVRLQMMLEKKEHPQVNEGVSDIGIILEVESRRIAEEHKRIEDLILNIEEVRPLKVNYADMVKFISELLDNAFKFSQPGNPVRVRACVEDDHYAIYFYDKGRGITEEQASYIGAYMQFDRWIYEQQGMGMGLAVVKLLAQVYDAQFEIRGEPDQGSSACLRFKQE